MSKRAFASWLFALLMVVLALASLVLRYGSAAFPGFTDALLRDIHARAGVQVQASDIHLAWRGSQIVLAASDVSAAHKGVLANAREIALSFDIGASWSAKSPRFSDAQFVGLTLELPASEAAGPVDPQALLAQLLVPLAMADRVQLLDAQVSGEGFELQGLNGRLTRASDGARVRLVGQALAGALGASFSAQVQATDETISGFVRHKARGAIEVSGKTRVLDAAGEAWLSLSPGESSVQWRGDAALDSVSASAEAQWVGVEGQPWRAQLRDISISGGLTVPELLAEQTEQGWRLSTAPFAVERWPAPLSALLNTGLATRLDAIAPTAMVKSLRAEWAGDGLRLVTELSDGRSEPLRNIPGGQFDSATVWLHGGLGMAQVEGINEFFSLAAGDSPAITDSGSGRVAWERTEPGHWSLASDTLALDSTDLKARGRFRLDLSPEGPELGLLLTLDSQGTQAQSRVPVRYFGEAGQRFWQQAQPQAVATDGLIWLFRSPRYPNQLTLDIGLADASLMPAQGWPRVTDARGRFRMNDADLRISVDAARFGEVQGSAAVRRVDQVWQVAADASIAGEQIPAFLAQTPLQLTAVTDAVAVQGDIGGRLSMVVGERPTGTLALDAAGATVEVRPLELTAEAVRGVVNIDLAKGLAPSQFEATLFDRPAKVSIESASGSSGVQVQAQASVPLVWATRRFAPALVATVKGRADTDIAWGPQRWSVAATVPAGALSLPSPLDGHAGTLSLTGDTAGAWRTLRFDNRLDLTQSDGLVSGGASSLDLLGWAGLLGGNSDSAAPRRLSLDTNQLRLGGIGLGQGQLQADSSSLRIDGPQVDAQLRFGPVLKLTAGSVQGRVLAPDAEDEPFSAPATMPDMDIAIGSLVIGDNRLTGLNTQIRSTDQDVAFNGLSFTLGGALMRGSARWSKTTPSSSADLRIETENLGELMRDRGWGEHLETRSALMDLTLDWPGLPWAPKIGQATGVVSLETTDGRFLDSPGAADALRLLGVLNISSLTRRLRLDFSDLLKPGLAFDRITGQARLRAGQLDFVQPLDIDGPSATMQLTGSSNLGTGQLDHRLRVQVPLSAQLPAATLLAGFPAIAAGIVLLADQVVGDSLKRIGETNYTVTGTFDEPVIKALRVEQ